MCKKKLITLSLVILSLNAFASKPSSKNCDYYNNVEDTYDCGPKGYPIDYGKRLCLKYLKAETVQTDSIKAWFPKVRLCLQKYLEDKRGSIRDCGDLKKKAIHSHVSCYIKTGFCSLPISDFMSIAKITSVDIIDTDIAALSLKVLKECSKKGNRF